MILVTGATGKLGTAVIQNLLKKMAVNQIAALVRDESKAFALKEKGVEIRIGSYDDTASLAKAMQEVEKVLLIAGTEENRRQQHQNVLDAAKKAGVQGIAYTSRNLKDRNTLANQLMAGHFDTEDDIKASGLSYTLFRNALYMDSIPYYVGEKFADTGIYLPAGHGRVSYALRSEMGEALAHALVADSCNNKTYNLTASEAYSFEDVAAVLTELSGKEVKYTPIERGEYEARMKAFGLPETLIQVFVGFLTDIKNGQEAEVTSDMENMLGRKPASLKEGLKVIFHL